MIETHTRILGIAPYDGMRTAMEQAAQAYPNVEMDIYTGDLEDGQAIVQQMPPNSYDCIISRGGTAAARQLGISRTTLWRYMEKIEQKQQNVEKES